MAFTSRHVGGTLREEEGHHSPAAGGEMAKKQSGAVLTLVAVDRLSRVPLFRQLEGQLRNAILAGSLPGGTRLPSSRMLAAELEISRPTVVLVLERLAGEGFLEARHGAGTFVARVIP
ncbi:MAG: hypothetical protein C0524_13185 [Rhodobacter sp.]|nr:hypothetical protein [Rhodobacter sp.]